MPIESDIGPTLAKKFSFLKSSHRETLFIGGIMAEKAKTVQDILLYINSEVGKIKSPLIKEHNRINALTVFYTAYLIVIHRGEVDRTTTNQTLPKFVSVCGVFMQISEDLLSEQEQAMLSMVYQMVKTPREQLIPGNLTQPPTGSTLGGIRKFARKLYARCF